MGWIARVRAIVGEWRMIARLRRKNCVCACVCVRGCVCLRIMQKLRRGCVRVCVCPSKCMLVCVCVFKGVQGCARASYIENECGCLWMFV